MNLLRVLLLGTMIGGLAACTGAGGGPPVVTVGDAGHSPSYMGGPCYF